MSDNEKIISRIKKILARAGDETGASEAERDTAMKMAHTLLVKHNLTMGDVTEKITDRVDVFLKGHRTPWERGIMNAIAKLFFCNYFSSDGFKRHYFIGREGNVATAIEIAKFVIKSVDKEADRVAAGRDDFTVFKRSFVTGAVRTIYNRCKTMREEAEQEQQGEKEKEEAAKTPGTSVVLSKVYEREEDENSNYVSKVLGVTVSPSKQRKQQMGMDGYVQGLEYGGKVHLGKQLA